MQAELDWILSRQDFMLEKTIELANINSGSLNAAGVNQVGQRLAQHCQAHLQLDTEFVELAPFIQIDDNGAQSQHPVGHALRIRKHPDAPLQVLLVAHLDTVFAADHPFQQVRRLDDRRIQGPGVTDLKGGIMVMLTALEALERSPWAGNIGWQILFNPDEEIGSISSAPLLAEAAQSAHLGLVYEPCMADGTLAGARKGSGNFTLVIRGRAAHAGREHHLGRNAICALSQAISQLDSLNGQRPRLTLNVGFISGGGAVNTVPDLALCRFNVRLQHPQDQDWCQAQFQKILAGLNQQDGFSAELHGQFTRPPKQLTATNLHLFQQVQRCAEGLGLALEWHDTGGCCDGNNLAAAGLPNVDTLGVRGGNIHSANEYLEINSLSERAQLSAALLMTLAQDPDAYWRLP